MLNIQEQLTSFAMLGAGWVMWLLILLSVFALAIILERARELMRTRADAEHLRAQMKKAYADGDIEQATKLASASPAYEAGVLAAGLKAAEGGAESVEEAMAAEKTLAKAMMERRLAFLGTVGNNAPFVGLLGTVIGIIRSFQALNDTQGQVSDQLMAEIGEALVATAIGLLVALPAVAFYNYFQRVIKGRLNWVDILGRDLLSHLKAEEH